MKNSSPHSSTLRDVAFITAGIGSAGMGIKGFLLSSHFIDGGVTGISMLLSTVFGVPLAVLLLVINLPFIALGYRRFGKWFTVKSIAAIAGLSLCLAIVPYPDVTPDLLLTAAFGGFFIGAGIGLAMRGGAVLDGTEIAALLISRHIPMLKVSDVILLMNIIIFGAAAFVLEVDQALYSMITYFAASKTIDFILNGIEEYTAMIVVSEHNVAIKARIAEEGWGATMLNGRNGFGKQGKREINEVLYSVITRLEVSRLREIIDEIDPNAFIIQHSVDDVMGGRIKPRPLH